VTGSRPWVGSAAGTDIVAGGREVGLGWDVSGRVVEVGPGVEKYAVGDLVAGFDDDMIGTDRALAEYVLLDDAVAPVPAGLDPVEAASIPLNYVTAHQALALLGSPAGRTLLVTGAGGAVGAGTQSRSPRRPAGTSPGWAGPATRSSSGRPARTSPRTPSRRRTTRCSTAPCSRPTVWRS